MTIEFILQLDNDRIVLPINPPNFLWSRGGSNETVQVVGIGDIAIPGGYGLANTSLESYFPARGRIAPHEYKDKLVAMWGKQKPINFTVTNMNQGSLLVLIENIEWDRRAGEEGDLYYTLDLTEYRAYGAQKINVNTTTNTVQPQTEQRPADTKPPTERTYIIVSGDTLWGITKKQSGSGDNWRDLYELNKSVVGASPNLIYPGTVLKMPEGWVTV